MRGADSLSEAVAASELRARHCLLVEVRGPFAVAVPGQEGAIRFHAVLEGTGLLARPRCEPVAFGPGDVLWVVESTPYVLADAPGRTPQPLERVLEEGGFDGSGPLVLGASGTPCVLLCGRFACAASLAAPLRDGLPPLLQLRAGGRAGAGRIAPLLLRLEEELRACASGHREVVRRLAELLLLEGLRAHALRPDAPPLLVDSQLARVLRAIHARPEAPWSLATMARTAGLSRTLFAERFRAHTGVPPMRYVAARRLRRACALLARPRCSVAEAARGAGYSSESAFTRAFRARYGAPPGVWRRTRVG